VHDDIFIIDGVARACNMNPSNFADRPAALEARGLSARSLPVLGSTPAGS
jgi:hypothetical protein